VRLSLLLLTLGGNVAQSSVVPMLTITGITPDLPFVLTVLLALRHGPQTGCLVGFAAGILQDVAGGGLLGVQALTKAMAGFGIGLLGERFRIGDPLVQVPGLVLVTIGEGLLRFGVLQLFHYPASLGGLMLYAILPQALFNGVLGASGVLAMAALDAVRARRL